MSNPGQEDSSAASGIAPWRRKVPIQEEKCRDSQADLDSSARSHAVTYESAAEIWDRGKTSGAVPSSSGYQPPPVRGQGSQSKNWRSTASGQGSQSRGYVAPSGGKEYQGGNPQRTSGGQGSRGRGSGGSSGRGNSGRQSRGSDRHAGDPRTAIIRRPATVSRDMYRRGTIIRLPFHVPNTHTDKSVGHPGISSSAGNHGLVYSENRMAIVLWRFLENMTCVPIYSFKEKGLVGQGENVERYREFIEITNTGGVGAFDKVGVHPVMEADLDTPFNRKSCVHVTGAFHVNYKEQIRKIGVLTDRSINTLVNVMDLLIATAAADA